MPLDEEPEPEWLDGEDGTDPAPRRRRPTRVVLLVSALVAAALVLAVAVSQQRSDGQLSPTPTPSSSAPADPRVAQAVPSSSQADALRLPGAGRWDLLARTDTGVLRIDLQTGEVIRTDHLELASSGPVAFVAGPDGVVIRPLDNVPGYLVSADGTATRLAGALRDGGHLLPAPRGLVWVIKTYDGSSSTAILTRTNGTPTSTRITVAGTLTSDGAGGLLLSDVGGAWRVKGTRLIRVTRGSVIAAGPTAFLLADCNVRHVCATSLYNRVEQSSRPLGSFNSGNLPSGTLSPDGRWASMFSRRGDGTTTLGVIDLTSGVARRAVPQDDTAPVDRDTAVVWTPDSRWLISLDDGRLSFYDPAHQRLIIPAATLPPIRQLALSH